MTKMSISAGKPRVSLLKLVLSREIMTRTHTLRVLNSKILKASITAQNGLKPRRKAALVTAENCHDIIYSDGHLLIRCPFNLRCLKIFCLNGPTNETTFLKSRIVFSEEVMKDHRPDLSYGAVINKPATCYRLGVNSVLYFITAKTIHTVDMKTGEFLENLDLPDGFLFSEIYLDDETGLLAVSSQKKFEKKIDILMVIVLYQCDTYLMFLQLLEIRKSVFGKTIKGAEISRDILFTIHENKTRQHEFKLYSLSDVCAQRTKKRAPPVLRTLESYIFGIMNIGTFSPFHSLEKSGCLSYRVRNLDTNNLELDDIRGKILSSFHRGAHFHPDGSPRLIFTEGGTLRICNIKDAIATVHSLDRATDLAECLKTTRKDGRVVKRHSNSVVLRKKLDEYSLVAWDYESNMDLLGVLYARPDRHKGQDCMVFVLELLDSLTCKLLRRIRLDYLDDILSDCFSRISLKLDADLCIVSIGSGIDYEGHLRVYRFTRPSDTE